MISRFRRRRSLGLMAFLVWTSSRLPEGENVTKMLVVTLIAGLLLGIPAKLTTMMTTTATGEWFDTSRDNRFWGR